MNLEKRKLGRKRKRIRRPTELEESKIRSVDIDDYNPLSFGDPAESVSVESAGNLTESCFVIPG